MSGREDHTVENSFTTKDTKGDTKGTKETEELTTEGGEDHRVENSFPTKDTKGDTKDTKEELTTEGTQDHG